MRPPANVEQPAPSSDPAGPNLLRARSTMLLLAWIVIACAMFMLVARPPEPPAVDPQDKQIRDRMAAWAVRDAERWAAEEGDLTLPWDEAGGHLAIVIDDVGRELDLFDKLLALRFRLSFSVLPGSIYAVGVQDRLVADHRRPRDILLHLPMEPMTAEAMRGVEITETFLLASDSPAELRRKLETALSKVPKAIAINNHMGSRLTADRTAMAAIMPVLRERGLLFLDSRTTPQTVAAELAEAAGVPTLSRKVFLDHQPGREAIRAALYEAAAHARTQPTIAIAHPSTELIEVLREELPRLHQQGVAVFALSELFARSQAGQLAAR